MHTKTLTQALKFLKPRHIDAYILTEVIGPMIGGMLFFTFVFLMFQVLRLADFLIVHGIPASILGKMVLLMILSFLPMALPIAFLIAVLMGFGRLSSDSEMVAMKACGISATRMAVPVALFSLIVVFLSLALNLEWVPWGQRMFKTTLIKLGNTKAVSSIKEGTFTSGFFDLLIYADKVNTKTQELERVFIFDEREKGNPLAVVSKHGEMLAVKTGSELGTSAMLRLYDGNIHQNRVDDDTYQKIDFKEYSLFLKIPEGLDDSVVKPKTLPYHELQRRVDNAANDPQAFREASTELWRRWATAFSPLIFVFLGIGFGTFRTRSVRAGAALIAFVVVLIYWAIQTWATSLSYDGKIPGWIAMQLPNLAVIFPALWSFRKSSW